MERVSQKNRSICLACALALVFSLFSCSAGGAENEASNSTADFSAVSDVLNADNENENLSHTTSITTFDGATVRVLCELDESGSDLCFEEGSQSEYSRLAQERDTAIEQKYDMCISYEASSDIFACFERNSFSDNAPHIVYARGSGGMSELMLYEHLDDLNLHLDESALYSSGMSADAIRQLSINGKLYMITGAPIKSSVTSTVAVGYNTYILKEYGYDSDYIDRLVLDGLWTHDAMHGILRVCSDATMPANEDSLYYLWQGMGATTVEKQSGDTPIISVYSPRNLFFFEHVHEYYSTAPDVGTDNLFTIDTIGKIGSAHGTDASIAPLPSFNERDGYTCVVDFANTYFTAIPDTVTDSRLAGCYLSALYNESVDGVYRETVNENSYGNEMMLDLILRSRHFDLLDMYGIGHIVRSAFTPESETADFDKLLFDRAEFAERALEITLGNKR